MNGTAAKSRIKTLSASPIRESRLRKLCQEFGRFGLGKREAEEVLELAGEDDHGDPGGEPDRDRVGHKLDEASQSQEACENQHPAGHQGGKDKAVHAVRRDGCRHDDDECACGPADLEAVAAKQRNEKSANDGGV